MVPWEELWFLCLEIHVDSSSLTIMEQVVMALATEEV